ncbi:MAG TPA: hypothetical protein VI547_14535 [Anaerolineales bacterium]|nr:hypothetical protein [Anaerolineales bacterium]
MDKVRKLAVNSKQLSVVCLLFSVLCLLAGYALISQSRAQTRGLDLGAPLNRPPNLYGANVDLLAEPDREFQLATLKEAGFGWVRQEFDWEATDRDQAEAMAASTRNNGLELVAVLTGERPPDPVAFAKFASEFAARNKNRIDFYQIWDEPNLEIGWAGPPTAAAYARVLQAASTAIREADPEAVVILAGLAATIETGPKNISDVLYLRQLYELGAGPYFDAAAGKPYGFNESPYDRAVDPNVLNFSRLILLREEMIAHGDGDKFLWASNFGWNTRSSIWGQVTAEQQFEYTHGAFERAVNEWPWAGPLFVETSKLNNPSTDPHEGFAMPNLIGVPEHIGALLPGIHEANHLSADAIFDGAWEFSELGADIPQEGPATITLNFIGAELAVTVRRANYRAYLYVTIDGQPANALPKATDGEAYAILTSPDLQPHIDTITLASGLAPGPHTAVIRADRGWDQWAIVSFTVGPNTARPNNQFPITVLFGVASLSFLAAIILFVRRPPTPRPPSATTSDRISKIQTALSWIVSLILWASAWLTWGDKFANEFRKYGDAAPFIVTALTAGVFYYSPFLILTLFSLAALFALFYLRPDLSLPLIAFFAPFYLLPRPLWDRAFSMVEICTVLGVAAVTFRAFGQIRAAGPAIRISYFVSRITPLDWAVAAFVVVSGLTTFTAEIQGVAIREFRVVVLEPAFFYFLLRVHLSPTPAFGDPSPELRSREGEGVRRILRVIDFFLLGAVVVALYGLSNLVTGQNLIAAEGGVARIRSVFGSPNNLGLYLGRAIPVAAAIALLGSRHLWRRSLYGLALLPLLAAAILSFSRGALVLGIPAALAVVFLFWGGRRAAIALGGLATLGGLALIPLSSNPRFANLFSTSSGTGFFRMNVWR